MNTIFSNRSIKLSSFLLLLLLAFCCFITDYKCNAFSKLKNFFEIPRYYTMEIVNLPFEFSKNLTKYLVLHKNLVQENNYLRQLVKIQATNLQILKHLESENFRLKNLLNFANSQKNFLSLANIIEVNIDPFKHQVVIDRGAKQGTYVGQPIVNSEGVLGSIVKVEKDISIGILITDLSYAIPVLNLRNGLRAIALGTGNLYSLNLQHIPKTADVKEGDIFITSGLGGKYPAGYIVGKVDKVKKEVNFPFASVSLELAAKLDRYREVLLVYNKTNILEKN